MRRIALAVFFMMPLAAEAQTPPKFSCQLSDDKLTLRVLVTNPYEQETHCSVNCHFNAPGGGTVSGTCARTVPGKAENFMLCMQERPSKAAYGALLPTSNAECVKPLNDADNKKEDEEDITKPSIFNRIEKDTLDKLKGLQKQN